MVVSAHYKSLLLLISLSLLLLLLLFILLLLLLLLLLYARNKYEQEGRLDAKNTYENDM